MDNFVDLGIVGLLFNSFMSYKITKRLSINQNNQLKFLILVHVFVTLHILALVFLSWMKLPYLLFTITILFFISFFFKVIRKLFFFLMNYYFNTLILGIWIVDLAFYEGILVVTYPSGLLYYLLVPIFMEGFYTFLLWVRKRSKQVLFEYDVVIDLQMDHIALKGYLDSGNALRINDLPVIFLSSKYIYLLPLTSDSSFFVQTIQGEEQLENSLMGQISLKQKKSVVTYDVLIAITKNRHAFHGYDCLLNINLIG